MFLGLQTKKWYEIAPQSLTGNASANRATSLRMLDFLNSARHVISMWTWVGGGMTEHYTLPGDNLQGYGDLQQSVQSAVAQRDGSHAARSFSDLFSPEGSQTHHCPGDCYLHTFFLPEFFML